MRMSKSESKSNGSTISFGRQHFIDWLKAVGMFIIVFGHVVGEPFNQFTVPVYPKQLGVTLFIFVNLCMSYSQTINWQKTNNPKGGVVNTIVKSPVGDLYIGLDNGWIYCSKDNGFTWEFVTNVFPYIFDIVWAVQG